MDKRPFPPPRPLSRAVVYSLGIGGLIAALSAADGEGMGASIGSGVLIAFVVLAVYFANAWIRRGE